MIRPATRADVPQLVGLARQFFEMTPRVNLVEFDEEDTAALISAQIDSPTAAAFVMQYGGDVVGAIAAVIAPLMFNSKQLMAHEAFWFVEEDHRGTPDSL